MGVTGAGKTTVGRAVAERLGWTWRDADEFHSEANVARMRAGLPLTDADRAPWLDTLRSLIERHLAVVAPLVLACSALREPYRSALVPASAGRGSVAFVQLDVSRELAERRLLSRPGHFMSASLVASQFATLEPPSDALRLDGARPVHELVDVIVNAFGL